MIDHRAPSFASLPWVEKMIPGFFFALLARFLHEGARNFLPPSLSELALALGAVCLLPPLSPHATCDDGDGDDDDDGGDDDDGDGDGDDDGDGGCIDVAQPRPPTVLALCLKSSHEV